MKKLLSIAIGVLFSVATTMAGNSEMSVSVSPAGAGQVAANTSNSTNRVTWGPTANTDKWSLFSNPTLYAFARNVAGTGYAFSHWEENGSQIGTNTTAIGEAMLARMEVCSIPSSINCNFQSKDCII